MAYQHLALPTPIVLHLRSFQAKRETQPVRRDERTGSWHVYRYADVARVLTDARTFGAVHFSGFPISTSSQSPPLVARRYAVACNLVREALTPRAVMQMQPFIERTVGELLDPLRSAGRLEVMSDLARPLARSVLAELLGVLVEEQEHLELSAEVEGERPTPDEMAASFSFVKTAACGVLSDMLGNTLLLLSLQPDVFRRLRREPAPFYSTIEEALRYLPPIWMAQRTVIAPVTLAGQKLGQGARVCARIVSANHDPEQFAHPDRFDIDRIPNRHLSFRDGSAFVYLGSGLARLVARLTLAAIVQRFAHFEFAPGDAIEVASPGEPEDALEQPQPEEQKPAGIRLPSRCSLAKLAVVFEDGD
jgi:cytochrome P450